MNYECMKTFSFAIHFIFNKEQGVAFLYSGISRFQKLFIHIENASFISLCIVIIINILVHIV